MEIIRKIVIVTDVTNYNECIIKLTTTQTFYNDKHTFILDKVLTSAQYNVYCTYCNIKYQGLLRVNITKMDLIGPKNVSIIKTLIIDDDGNYNRCLEMVNDSFLLSAPGENTYSRYYSGNGNPPHDAITFYAS